MLPDARQAYSHLLDARVQRPGRDVDALEQLDLLGTAEPIERIVLRVQRRECRPGQHLDLALLAAARDGRSEEHTSELQSLMRISYAVFCLKKKHIARLHNRLQKIDKTNMMH